jgi:hypothetical protein
MCTLRVNETLSNKHIRTHNFNLPVFEEAALSVAAMFAFRSADERIVAGIFVWAARDCTTPDEALSSADCSWS